MEYSGHMNNKNNSTSKETTENILNYVKHFAAINGYPQPRNLIKTKKKFQKF